MIMSANGPQKLIIPVRHSRKKNEILHDYNVKIDNTQNWKVKHWKSIQNAYRSSLFLNFMKRGFLKFFLITKNYYTLLILILFRTLTIFWVFKKILKFQIEKFHMKSMIKN